MSTYKGGHNTQSEIAFLRKLGVYKKRKESNKTTRLDLLKKYLKTIDIREHWGDIDFINVTSFVNGCIEKEEALLKQ